jgi:hypothetical protein
VHVGLRVDAGGLAVKCVDRHERNVCHFDQGPLYQRGGRIIFS